MKKLALFLFGIGALMSVSFSSYADTAGWGEPCSPAPCDTVCAPVPCNPAPCDTVCPAVPCTPAPCGC